MSGAEASAAPSVRRRDAADGELARVPLWALGVLVLGLALWRAHLVGLGPDPDSDAYGHHVIARKVLASPGGHGVHWVWLPLFHWLQVPLIALGGTMQWVRYANVAIWAAVPLVLFGYLRRRDASPAWVAALAGAFAALCPIGMQMGTTAQPEPLFALMMVAFAWTYDARRFGYATLLLSAAVLIRYEAWAVLLGVGLHQLWRRIQLRSVRDPHDGYRDLWPVFVPGLAVLGWALIRLPVDGRLFGFVLDTRRFATEVHAADSAFEAGLAAGLRDVLYYAYDVAFRVYGWAIVLFPLGLWRALRLHRGLAISGLGCLFFVTLTWVMRGTLGLDRHFVAVIPFYAATMAIGLESLARLIQGLTSRRSGRGRPKAPIAVGALGGLASLALVVWGLWVWMGHWRGAIVGGFRDRLAVAAYLRTAPEEATIFCDEATVEVLSELPSRRFDRRAPDAKASQRRILEQAQRGPVYVATWVGKLKPLREHGEIVFQPEGATETSGLAVLRVQAQGGDRAQ